MIELKKADTSFKWSENIGQTSEVQFYFKDDYTNKYYERI